MMRYILISIFITLGGLSAVSAQDTYQSLKGQILLSCKYEGQIILAQSQDLNLFLDYTTKEFKGKLDLGSLDTGVDTLNAKLADIKPGLVLFSGVIPNDDFITWEHLELEFIIPLTIDILGERLNSSLNIQLNHYKGSNSYACHLSGTMSLDLSILENQINKLGTTVEVEFTQILMRRER
ncbi:MAG: hypothetical protein IPJ06_04935 [Saprospiraceae bacterium]|nr:hypothetical protein [Saprospiraceae bacterium]